MKRANKDLEEDRNKIRKNLKTMLDVQMKEAYQLLGLQPPLTTTNLPQVQEVNSISRSSAFDADIQGFLASLDKKMPISSSSLSQLPIAGQETTSSSSSLLDRKTLSPKTSSSTGDLFMKDGTATGVQNSTGDSAQSTMQAAPVIKDEFILSQIDLINKYYQIDSKTLVKTAQNASSSSSSTQRISGAVAATSEVSSSPLPSNHVPSLPQLSILSTLAVNKRDEAKFNTPPPQLSSQLPVGELSDSRNVEKSNTSPPSSTSRASELKHYIEILLNRFIILNTFF